MASNEDAIVPGGPAMVEDEPQPLGADLGAPPRPKPKRPSSIVPLPNQQGAAFVAAQRDPARHAKVIDLASRLNMSPGFVDQNYDALAKVEDRHDTQTAIDGASPTLRNWLSDPDNASIAKHEIGPLAQVDKGAKLLTPRAPFHEDVGPLDAVGTGIATGMSDLAKSTGWFAAAFGHATPDQVAPFIADMAQRSKSLRAQAPDYAKEFNEAMALHEGNVDKAWRTFIDGQPEAQRQGIMRALVEHAKGGAQTLGETLSLIGAAVSRPKGLAYQGIESLASMAPMLAGTAAGGATGAAIGSIVPGAGTAVGGAVGAMAGTFAGIAPINVGAEIEAELQKRGVDPTDVNQVKKALSDPQLMAMVRGKALAGGLTSAGVMALFQGFAGKLAGSVAKAGGGAVAKTAAGAGEAVIQAGGVAAGQEAGAAAQGEPTSPGRAISTTLQMLGVGAATHLAGGSRRALLHPETASAGAQVHAEATDALRAQHDAQVLTEVGQAVKEAQTTGSVPDGLKSLIETATGGQDAATVYFQSGDWDKYWQSQGASPAKAAADIMGDDGKAYHDAQATGARLAIPLSDYIARVAPTQHFEGLIDVARTRLDGMSFGEAREYLQSLPATMKELADEATAQAKGEPEPLETSAQQVRLDVEDQLLKAGFAPVAARTQAQVYESAFRTLGAREGVSARELFNRYGLTIGRGPLEPTPEATATLEKAKAAAKAVPTEAPVSDEAEAARLEEEEGGGIHVPELARPRTASGRLKNLAKASPEEIANEYRLLIDANAAETSRGRIAETDTGDRLTVGTRGSLRAGGRIAARAKTIAKLEAEMAKRGMDQGETYMSGSQNARAQSPDAFPFGALEQPGPAGEARGRILIGGKDGLRIELLAKADKSTFLHETGHVFTTVISDLAAAPNASEGIKADWQALRDWVGAEEGKELNTEQHEQIARGFEAYLMEGKAPSVALRSAFYRFKNWLLGVYKNLRALNVELTPEVRGVFDRLLASKEEIEQARQEQHAQPLFSDQKASGMNDKEWAGYLKADADAKEEQESKLTTELMKQIRLEESKEWQAWRDPIKEEVTKQIDDSPLYKAVADMKRDENPVQLDRAAVKELLGDQASKVTRKGYTSEEGGLHPDVVADMYGFASGRELLDALSTAPSRTSAIEQATDARMQAEHGERLTDAEVSEKASAAVNGDKRALLLRREAEALAFSETKKLVRMATRVIPPDAEVKAQAASIIGSTKVREVRPDLFEKAAARLGKESVEAVLRGDRLAAFDAKIKQILAVAVAKAATDAKDAVDKGIEDFKKVFRPDARIEKTRDMSFVNGARALLADLGIGSSDKGATAYLDTVRQYAPDAYDNVQAISEDIHALKLSDYRDLTSDQFTELTDAVKQLWTMARKAKQVTFDGKTQQLEEVLGPVLQQVTDRQSDRTMARGQAHALTAIDKLANVALSAEASLRRVESWARYMDGLNPLGPLSNVVRQVLKATTAYREHKTQLLERIVEASKVLDGIPDQRDIEAPELGYTFKNRNELLGAMLHTGNAEGPTSNLAKLLLGRGWGSVDEETGVFDRSRWDGFVSRMQKEGVLTKAHYDWLQAAGDFFEELKPQLQEAKLAVDGRYMKEVKHTPFATPYGEYKGWYYPAIGDTHVAGGAEIENAMRHSEEQTFDADSKFLFTQPAAGFTKTRTGQVWPLVMDASQLPRHLDAVLKFIYMAEPTRDVFKVFNHRDFREAMAGVNPKMVQDGLMTFLRAASSQRATAPETTALGSAFAKMVNYVRQGATMQVVGGNVVILAEQVLHSATLQAMRTADNKAMVYYHDVAGAAARILLSPRKLTDLIHEQSPTVATRDHMRLQVAEAQYRDLLDPQWALARTGRDVMVHSIGFVAHLISSMMDKAVWLGARDRAEQRGINGQDAIDYADAVVRQGLGAHNPEDVAEVQRGQAWLHALLGLYGFYNTKANQIGTDAFAQTMTGQGLQRSKMRMAAVATMGLLMMGITGAAARDIIGGRKKKEDEGWGDVLGEWAGWGTAETMGRMVPGGAIPITAAKMFFKTKGATADNMLSSPATSFLDNFVGTARVAGRLTRGEEVTGKDVKDVLGLFGTLFHVPLKVLARPISYQLDIQQGKTTPTGPIDYTRGLLTGQKGR